MLLRLICGIILAGLCAVVGISLSNTIHPAGIVIHHSARSDKEGLADLDALHQARGFGAFYWGKSYHVGYHYLILPDGSIVKARPEHLRGAHTLGHNDMIGICLIGNFDSGSGGHPPTAAQLGSLIALSRKLAARYGFPSATIHEHKDLETRTVCPGDLFPFSTVFHAIARDNIREN